MRIATVNPAAPREDRLAEPVRALDAGLVIALPTETFYGLAVDAANVAALARLNELKRKPADSPILLLLGERGQIEQVSAGRPPGFDELTKMFWPGPLTLVVPAAPQLPQAVSGGRGTVAVRVPGLELPRALARRLGRPISGISANLYRDPPCRTALEVAQAFPEGLDWILDGGPTTAGAPSTIVDLSVSPPVVLRAGLLPPNNLRPFLPDLVEA